MYLQLVPSEAKESFRSYCQKQRQLEILGTNLLRIIVKLSTKIISLILFLPLSIFSWQICVLASQVQKWQPSAWFPSLEFSHTTLQLKSKFNNPIHKINNFYELNSRRFNLAASLVGTCVASHFPLRKVVLIISIY